MNLWERRRRRGKRSPLDYRPALDEDLHLPWLAFVDLREETPADEPIGVARIRDWMDVTGMACREARAAMYRLVTEVDRAWRALKKEDDADSGSGDRGAEGQAGGA